MKRILALLFATMMVLTFASCSNKTKDIEGTISGYVQVQEYTNPLLVIENNGNSFYAALVGNSLAAIDFDHADDALLEEILKGEITDIKVHIENAEKGKTLEISGQKITVWQSHQIQKTEL